jgi:hypothetical protein
MPDVFVYLGGFLVEDRHFVPPKDLGERTFAQTGDLGCLAE